MLEPNYIPVRTNNEPNDYILDYWEKPLFNDTNKPRPVLLYHHSESAKLIKETGIIRASNVKEYLHKSGNDSNEFYHFIEIISYIMEKSNLDNSQGLANGKINKGFTENFKNDLTDYLNNFYLICFTYENNNKHLNETVSKQKIRIKLRNLTKSLTKNEWNVTHGFVSYNKDNFTPIINNELIMFSNVYKKAQKYLINGSIYKEWLSKTVNILNTHNKTNINFEEFWMQCINSSMVQNESLIINKLNLQVISEKFNQSKLAHSLSFWPSTTKAQIVLFNRLIVHASFYKSDTFKEEQEYRVFISNKDVVKDYLEIKFDKKLLRYNGL